MKKKILNHIAKCLCGGINIKVKGKLRHVSNCHCSQCMKTHGNYASYTSCEDNQITYVSKKTLKWFKSSKIAKRGFCSMCWASVFYKRYKSNRISIAAGMFNKNTKLKTYANIFTQGKMNYYKLDKSIPKYKRYNN